MKIVDLLPIHTDRLEIKQTTVDDIDLILKMDKQEETQKFLGGIKNKSREERVLFLEKKNLNGESLTVFYENIPIGFIGIKINGCEMEISYIFDVDYTGRGFCSEVVQKLTDIIFNKLEINRIYANSKEENLSSQKVLLKNKFVKKCFKDNFWCFELLKNEK